MIEKEEKAQEATGNIAKSEEECYTQGSLRSLSTYIRFLNTWMEKLVKFGFKENQIEMNIWTV